MRREPRSSKEPSISDLSPLLLSRSSSTRLQYQAGLLISSTRSRTSVSLGVKSCGPSVQCGRGDNKSGVHWTHPDPCCIVKKLGRQCHGNSDGSAARRRLASSDETDIV